MTTLTISLADDRLAKLQEKAGRIGVSVEELARLSITELLACPDDAFEEAVAYVLDKNADLYMRLDWLRYLNLQQNLESYECLLVRYGGLGWTTPMQHRTGLLRSSFTLAR